MKTKGVQAISMAVLVVAAMLLVAPTATEGRALLNLGKLIDHFLDCPPPPAEEAPAPEPAYSAPYYSPPDVEAPAPDAYSVPNAPVYQSPPGPPYADSPPSPISEPAPVNQTPPAGGY